MTTLSPPVGQTAFGRPVPDESTASSPVTAVVASGVGRERIESIDALRGLIMFTMIVVNRLAGSRGVPAWLEHYEGPGSGLTFVDLVFPAFLFIAGMSIPFALGARLKRGESPWRVLGHVAVRAASLLLIGVMMVNGRPDEGRTGMASLTWEFCMYACVLAAFCVVEPPRAVSAVPTRARAWRVANLALRGLGFAGLAYLAFAFRGRDDERIVQASPFYVNAQWWGILGQIGWSYLTASVVFLLFRGRQTAVLACVGLMVGMFVAAQAGTFAGLRVARHVDLGIAFGTHAMLTTAGLLLGLMLLDPQTRSVAARVKFTLLMVTGFTLAACLLGGAYGVRKNSATPSWALIGCAATAALWLVLYLLGDVLKLRVISRPLAIAGQNVLLAYLLAAVFSPALSMIGLLDWYYHTASGLTSVVVRATATAVVVLGLAYSAGRAGARLRL